MCYAHFLPSIDYCNDAKDATIKLHPRTVIYYRISKVSGRARTPQSENLLKKCLVLFLTNCFRRRTFKVKSASFWISSWWYSCLSRFVIYNYPYMIGSSVVLASARLAPARTIFFWNCLPIVLTLFLDLTSSSKVFRSSILIFRVQYYRCFLHATVSRKFLFQIISQ